MFKAELFLGFPLDPIYAKKLEKIDPILFSQFVQHSENDLKEIKHEEMRYLGKTITGILSLSELELLEQNIYSFLKKLVPNHPYEETPLYLFAF